MIGYINRKSCCCYTAITDMIMGYMNGRLHCCYIVVSGGIMHYVNRRSHCCHIAASDRALESGKKAQFMEYQMRKGRLINW